MAAAAALGVRERDAGGFLGLMPAEGMWWVRAGAGPAPAPQGGLSAAALAQNQVVVPAAGAGTLSEEPHHPHHVAGSVEAGAEIWDCPVLNIVTRRGIFLFGKMILFNILLRIYQP